MRSGNVIGAGWGCVGQGAGGGLYGELQEREDFLGVPHDMIRQVKLLIRSYFWISWGMFIGGVIGWPISALTVAKGEPPFILGLSWLAIIVAGLGNIIAADVRRKQEEE